MQRCYARRVQESAQHQNSPAEVSGGLCASGQACPDGAALVSVRRLVVKAKAGAAVSTRRAVKSAIECREPGARSR